MDRGFYLAVTDFTLYEDLCAMLSVKADKIKKLFHASCVSRNMQVLVVADLQLYLLSEEDGDF